MKKTALFALTALLLFSTTGLASCGRHSSSQDHYSIVEGTDGLIYELNESKDGYILMDCATVDTEIVIPELYNNLPVREIGDEAFMYTTIDSLFLPRSLRTIGDRAFLGLSSESLITKIEIPEGVTSIGEESFRYIPSVKEIVLPSTLETIGDRAFGLSTNLAKITLSSDNPYFATSSNILYTKDMTELVYYPEAIKSTTYDMPNTVTKVRANALYGNQNLTSISLSSSLKEVERRGMAALFNVTTLPLHRTQLETIGELAFSENSSVTAISLPDTVKTLGVGAFYKNSSLTSFSFRSDFEELPDEFFSNCSKLAAVDLPKSLKKIGAEAFYGCLSFSRITIPDGVTTIGDSAFSACTNLKTVKLPASLTEIAPHAFSYCRNISTLDFPSGITSIGDSAFSGCSSLKSLDLVNTKVVTIEKAAFLSCSNIASITFPSTLRSIGEKAFQSNTSLKQLALNDGLESIGESAFYDYRDLTKAYVPASVKSIGTSAFSSIIQSRVGLTLCFEASSVSFENYGNPANTQFGVTRSAYEAL